MKGKKNWTVLTIIFSIVDLIWLFGWIVGAEMKLQANKMFTSISFLLLACAFPIAHIILTYVLMRKEGRKTLKELTVLTIILLIIDAAWFFFWAGSSTGSFFGLALALPIAHIIFAYALSLKKNITTLKQAEALKGLATSAIILSIVDFVWVVAWSIISFARSTDNNFHSYFVLICIFPLFHAIVAFVLSSKKHILSLKILSVIGFVLSLMYEILLLIFQFGGAAIKNLSNTPLNLWNGTETAIIILIFLAPIYAIFLALFVSPYLARATKKTGGN